MQPQKKIPVPLTVLLNPKFGVFVLLFLQLGLTQSTERITITEIVFIIFFSSVIIGWVLRQLLKKKIAISHSPFNLPVSLFLGFCFFSLFKAFYNNVDIIDWIREVQVFLVVPLFFVISNEFQSKKELKWLIYCFLLIAALICLQDIFLVIPQEDVEWAHQMAGPQYASLYFIMAIPISIAIFLTTKNFWLKWLQISLILLFIFRLSISLMRSYILAILIALIIFIAILLVSKILKNRKLFFRAISLIFLMFIILGVASLVFAPQINRTIQNNVLRFTFLEDFYSPQNISALSRIEEIKAAWNYALQQPLLGHGFGFKYQYYRPDGEFCDISYVHFVPLFFLLKIGLFGVLSLIWLIIRVLSLNWQVFREEKDFFWKLLELALFSNLIGVVVLSFYVTSVVRIDSIFYLTLTIGIIATIKKLQNKLKPIHSLSPPENYAK